MTAMLQEWGVLRTADRSALLGAFAWAPLSAAYFGIQAVLLNLYLLRLGFDLKFIGLMIASGQVVWAASALPAGAAGRRLGLRRVLIWSSLLMSASMALFLLVEFLPRALWPAGLILCWMGIWVGAAIFGVNSTPYVTQVTTPRDRNHVFSIQQAVILVFGFVGSVVAGQMPGLFAGWLGGTLAEPRPYWLALWLAPPLYGVASLIWGATRPVSLADEAAESGAAASPLGLYGLLGLIVFLQTTSEGAINAFFNVYLDAGLRLPTAQIGVMLGVGRLLSVIAVAVLPQFMRRLGTARTMAWSSAGTGLMLVPIAAIANAAAAAVGFVGVMSLVTANAIGRTVFSQEIVPARLRTTTAAIVTIGLAAGWSSAAAAGGFLIAWLGYSGFFLVTAASAGLAAVVLFVYVRAGRGLET